MKTIITITMLLLVVGCDDASDVAPAEASAPVAIAQEAEATTQPAEPESAATPAAAEPTTVPTEHPRIARLKNLVERRYPQAPSIQWLDDTAYTSETQEHATIHFHAENKFGAMTEWRATYYGPGVLAEKEHVTLSDGDRANGITDHEWWF